MVHSYVYDNLLSASRNRASYEKLWTVSKATNKYSNKQRIESINIGAICENLLRDIIDGDGTMVRPKQSFYVAVQLTLGAIKVYKWQIDSLFDNAQAAMVTYSYRMAEFELLSQKSRRSDAKKPGKRSVGLTQVESEMELNMYEIMGEEVFAVPTSNKKIARSKKVDKDTTLVQDEQTITINDERPEFSLNNFERRHDLSDFNDFGEATQLELDSFMSILESKGEIENEGIPISFDINMDPEPEPIRSNQSQKRLIDEQYLDTSNKRQRVSDDDLDAIHMMNSIEAPQLLTPIVESFETSENFQPIIPERMSRISTPILDDGLNQPFFDVSLIRSPLPRIKGVQRTIKKGVVKKKLVFDKITKIPASSMQKFIVEYEDLMTTPPMLTFRYRKVELISTFDKLLAAPLHVTLSVELMKLYKNNLVKVSNAKSKKKPVAKSTSVAAKPQTRSTINVISDIDDNSMQPLILSDQTIPTIESMIVDDRIMTYDNDYQNEETSNKVGRKVQNDIEEETYNEKNHWTSQMVLDRLAALWKENSGPITMQRICNRENSRFVRAGIFYKLLNLQRLGLIHLVQIEGSLGIWDIEDREE